MKPTLRAPAKWQSSKQAAYLLACLSSPQGVFGSAKTPFTLESFTIMADKFDPYREALVVEVDTQWPEDHDDLSLWQRSELSRKLHENAEEASHLEYLRTHTGFCRRIVVTKDDIDRFGPMATTPEST